MVECGCCSIRRQKQGLKRKREVTRRTSHVRVTKSGSKIERRKGRIVAMEDPKVTIAPRRVSERDMCSESAIATPKRNLVTLTKLNV